MIWRHSPIEPIIGHMKAGGKLDRNGLNGTLGDAISMRHWAIPSMLCCAGHNLHMIPRKLQLFLRANPSCSAQSRRSHGAGSITPSQRKANCLRLTL